MNSSVALAQSDPWDEGFITLKSALSESIVTAEAAFRQARDVTCLPTGLKHLDGFLGGLHPSELVLVAGRLGAGKTSLAASIAFNVARSGPLDVGDPVGFFSLEMSSEQLATRIISMQTGIPSSRIRRGEFTESEFESLVACSQLMQKIPLFIDQTGGISIAELAARARRLKRQHGLALIVVDYLQLMRAPSQIEFDERYDISTISRGLKAVAEDLNIPVLALSRLPPAAEQRDNEPFVLSDLQEFGSIVQDADVVMFLDDRQKRKEPVENARGSVDVIVAKPRIGPAGVVTLNFDAPTMRFSSGSGGDLPRPSVSLETSISPYSDLASTSDLPTPTGFSESQAFLERAAALPDQALRESLGGDAVPAYSTAELIGGESALGQSIRNSADLARAVQAGLPTVVLDYLRDAGFSSPEIEAVVAPARTLARRRKEGRLTVDESAAVERIARILVVADRVLGSRESALAWLRRPQTTRLGGSMPLGYLHSDIGARVVEEILLQAEYGLTA